MNEADQSTTIVFPTPLHSARRRLSSTPPPPPPGPTSSGPNPPPPPTALKQRLDQVFGHAKRSFEKGDTEYAHTLFSQCVSEMPGSIVYLQHFRANLTRHTPEGKKGGRKLIKARGSAVTKHGDKGDWQTAFLAGCDALKKNPSDITTLHALAAACDQLGHPETQLGYLKWALDAAPQDRETNRLAAAALEVIHEYDQAIACWRRVLQQKPTDEEANKSVSRLSVEKTIHEGGYKQTAGGANNGSVANDADPDDPAATPPSVAGLAKKSETDAPSARPKADEATLVAAINDSPDDPAAYAALADLCLADGRTHKAERLLAKAVRLSGDSLELLEKLEAVRLRRVREAVAAAQQRVAKHPGPEAADAYRSTLHQGDQIELEVYAARAERQPGDPRRQFDLGVRLKRVGRHRDAIKALQAAREDKPRTAETQLYLGECFQQIKQFRLAATSYEASIQASSDAPAENAQELGKLALYRAGVLAMGMGDLDTAEQRLTELAGHDFAYRDVADRLDKIAEMRKAI